MKTRTGVMLSAMMFMEYFIWSAWYVTMGTYMISRLQATGIHVGAAYSALAVATMVSPLFVGLVADRFFPAQKIMGWLHLLGAVLLIAATKVTANQTFYWIVLAYSLLYMPTIALSNNIAFYQMDDAGKQFPWIRVFGTVGWILAGLLVGYLNFAKTANSFYLAAGVSVALGLFSFFLPNTPPKGSAAQGGNMMKDAGVLFRSKAYLIFFIAAVLVCIPLAFYYSFANSFLDEIGMTNAAGKMILGQVSEGLFILAIPFLFNRIGVKKMLLIGMGAWVLRYICFAYGYGQPESWLLYSGIILHGVCYDFFFVTGYMYTEKKAGEGIKNGAQGLFTFATYGLGMFVGTWFAGFTVDRYQVGGAHLWKSVWMVPAGIAFLVLLYFVFFFSEKKQA
ncbi:nucleoside permease [Flavihumibacter petaseus]|uniref:Putative nucleoside transporter n=1 Tax=Flavihumibacter petaseus NBRC 106054 TaxID=1220578 RepID=A0A0E9N667_9BACT|nr:nucleoside permease [Flavihumibacter petaseus]GAO44850.1 putative nucleoside transporter [Flavihumibacter petaseus NBRC 106054]